MLRAACCVLTCAGLAGCNPSFGTFHWGPYDPGGSRCVSGTEPAPARACDAPTTLSADDVVDVHSFRAVASAVVCDWTLRCGFGADSYCHPGYAEWESGSSEPAGFDLDAARACIRAVVQGSCMEGLYAASACHEISLHGSCVDCPLTCDACAAAREGEPCDPAAATPTCDAPLVCGSEGRCVRAPLRVCDGVTVEPVGHFGCPCTAASECPSWTGACVAGRCVERPFAGAPCDPDGAACFESLCDHQRCRALELGEGPCGGDASCAAGLVCGLAHEWSQPASHLCGPPIPVGGACGPTVTGRCGDHLHCRDDGVCVPP